MSHETSTPISGNTPHFPTRGLCENHLSVWQESTGYYQ